MKSLKERLSRRAALKMGGGSGLGLFALLSGAGQKPMARGSLLKTSTTFRHLKNAIEGSDDDKPKRAYSKITRAYHAERQFTKKSDLEDLDHDISCLRSVSPAAKLHMQRQRAIQYDDWITRMRKAFGLVKDDDDYNWY